MNAPFAFCIRLIPLIFLIASQSSPAFSNRVVSDSQKRIGSAQEFLEAVRTVERDPLGPAADVLHGPMIDWMEQTSEVTIHLCGDLAPLVKPHRAKSILFFQYMTGSAVHQLRNPTAAVKESQVAGLQAVVELYTELREKRPQEFEPVPYAESLVQDARQYGKTGLEKHTCQPSGSPANKSVTNGEEAATL